MSVRRRSITSRLTRDLNREIGSHEFTRGMFEARGKALELADQQIGQLRGELSLAEEGLANYVQEVERLRAALALSRDWYLNGEGWKPGDPSVMWAEKFECAARACEALFSSSEPQTDKHADQG